MPFVQDQTTINPPAPRADQFVYPEFGGACTNWVNNNHPHP
jgi:hypothetical protein